MPLFKRIFQYIKPYKGRMTTGIISMIIHAAITVYFFHVFKGLIETLIGDISKGVVGLQELSWRALSIIIIFFFKGVFYYGQKYLISYVSQKAVRDIRQDLYAHLQSLSMSFYNKNKTGEIISRVTNDVGILQGAIVNGAMTFFYELLTMLGMTVYLFYLNVRLTIFLVLLLPIMAYILSNFNKKIRRVSKHVQIKIADISDILQETLSAVKVVKSFGREKYQLSRFATENEANFRARLKNTQYSAAITSIMEFLAAISFTAILWYGGYEVFNGRMAAEELITYFIILLAISSPLRSISRVSSVIQQALASAERIFETMDIDTYMGEKSNALELTVVKGRVDFKDVSFSYKEGEVVLEEIILTANPGEIIALVGSSGAGKTTLVDLIPRFYDPDSGVITVDGYDIKDLKLSSLREHIGIVPQETVLFSGSIHDNIAFGNLGASESDIIAAARAANANDFVEGFTDGYNTVVGERGVGLSGGQRQRIAIARAILKNPQILILDEATSALDRESEALVQEALDRLMKDRTTFVIAHRLTTIIKAHKIVVLDRGRIVEVGTHKELLGQQGVYARLYQGQFKEE